MQLHAITVLKAPLIDSSSVSEEAALVSPKSSLSSVVLGRRSSSDGGVVGIYAVVDFDGRARFVNEARVLEKLFLREVILEELRPLTLRERRKDCFRDPALPPSRGDDAFLDDDDEEKGDRIPLTLAGLQAAEKDPGFPIFGFVRRKLWF